MTSVQVLVDADNLDASRLRIVAAVLCDEALGERARAAPPEARCTVAGRPGALAAVEWPPWAEVVAIAGWQRADLTLADAYQPGLQPLVLVSGDGDFVHLASRHAGPVLVVAAASARAARLQDVAAITDPAVDGPAVLARWLLQEWGA